MHRILFICSGNMYRSAGAEFILRKKLNEAGIEGWTVDSAGTLQLGHARRPSGPYSPRKAMTSAARRNMSAKRTLPRRTSSL